ELSSLRSEDTA
nr:immunoglobulin heavy chain junction region [Homo sapiens]